MNILDIIRTKRDKKNLSKEQIEFFVKGYVDGTIKDYQASALLMAIYINSLNEEEATNFAIAMEHSGEIMDLSDIPGFKVDKHSTGGVGDKVSLVLAPLVATFGLKFAKMSGRGLGHTGGTIDKLESIKGFQTSLSKEQFIKQVNEIGISIIGQSSNITPADKKIYALRDVTETVNNIGLIASSIMSKKLASGSDIIILDVKYGKGAFMKTEEDAKKLAKLMVKIGNNAGRKVEAIITDMNEPLGHKIGNALEIYEVIEALNGNGPHDLMEVVYQIASEQLILSDIAKTKKEAYALLDEKIKNKEAFNKFKEFISWQGGELDSIENKDKLIKAKTYELLATKEGFISSFETENIGIAAKYLGAGRTNLDDEINHFVGLDCLKKIGDKVSKGDIIVRIYHDEKGLEDAINLLNSSITIDKKFKKTALIADIIK